MIAEFDIGAAYESLLTNTDMFVGIEGQRGTSKTRSILCILMALSLEYPGSRTLLCRNTRVDLTETVLMTLEDEVFPIFGLKLPGGASRATREEYPLFNGSSFFPVGVDQGHKLLSRSATYAYVAEAIEIEEQKVRDIVGCMRYIKSIERPYLPDRPRIFVDTNPGPPGHWFNLACEPVTNDLRRVEKREDYLRLQEHNTAPAQNGKWKRLITKHQDNPGYWDHEVWDYTEAGATYINGALATLTGHKRRRWLLGEWASAEGSVYQEFEEARHVIRPFEIPDHWPHFVGIDPGYDHPCAILWFALAPTGCLYIVDELYRGGLSVHQHAESIRAHNPGRTIRRYLGDPQHAFSCTAQSPKSIASQFKDCGITLVPWPRTQGKEESMVEAVREKLNTDMLKVFATCSNTIMEFQSWSYKRTAKGELPPGEDKFEDEDNHAMDVVKGVVAAKPWLSSQVEVV